MLLEDQLEPVARAIADFLSQTGGHAGSSWAGYDFREDLIPLARKKDDEVEYVRARNHQARLQLFNVHEVAPDPKTIVIHPSIVLESEPKATTSITINNLKNSEPSEPFVWNKEWRTGESEANAVEAGWQHESWGKASVSGGVEGVAEAEAEAGFKDVVSAAWSQQTGRTKDIKVGGVFPLSAGPFSLVEGFLRWNEQTLQRRIECYALQDFGIRMGRRSKHKRKPWGWNSGSPIEWASVEHLLAVMEHRGSVHHARYEYYSRKTLHPNYVRRINERRRLHIDRLTPPFMGADGIKIVIKKIETGSDGEE